MITPKRLLLSYCRIRTLTRESASMVYEAYEPVSVTKVRLLIKKAPGLQAFPATSRNNSSPSLNTSPKSYLSRPGSMKKPLGANIYAVVYSNMRTKSEK
jgi:hypothetical protein